jgi:hypothetical protein
MEDMFDVRYRFEEGRYRRFVGESQDPDFTRQIGTILQVADWLYEHPDVAIRQPLSPSEQRMP